MNNKKYGYEYTYMLKLPEKERQFLCSVYDKINNGRCDKISLNTIIRTAISGYYKNYIKE